MRKLLIKIYQDYRWWFFYNYFTLPSISLDQIIGDNSLIDPPIKENLCLPPFEGPISINDIGPLLAITKQINPKNILELGTAYGSTVSNLCLVCEGYIYTVNALPEQIEGKNITFRLDKSEIGYIYRKYGFENRVQQIYENTKKLNVSSGIPIGVINLAIIDACHDIDFVINDFLVIQPFLNNKSIIFLHDVHPSMQGHLKDSYLACMYLRRMGYNLKYLSNTWWGIWQSENPSIKSSFIPRFLKLIDTILSKLKVRTYEEDAYYLRRLSNQYINCSPK
jgi:predicted O-methyltransferase YrrM